MRPSLDDLEKKILILMACNVPGGQIAVRVDLKTERQVKYRVRRICDKFGVNHRAAAIAQAVRRGLILPNEIPLVQQIPSPREAEALFHHQQGKDRYETAKEMGLAPEVVARYLAQAMNKLEAKNLANAAKIAQKLGLFDEFAQS